MDEFGSSQVVVSALPSRAAGGKPAREIARRPPGRVNHIKYRYDSAKTTDENRRYWVDADSLSAKEANSAEVRRILRIRSRYEVANNSYAKGVVKTLANDTIGTGPRPQLLTGDDALNTRVEAAFAEWCAAARLASKLRTAHMAKSTDGEAFLMFVRNPAVSLHPGVDVQLDVQLVEADQVSTPILDPVDRYAVDGIRYDRYGNPSEYHLLATHPGDPPATYPDYSIVAPENMIHWFDADRPGQCRGVPVLTPSLNLFGQLRRYTLATLAAAETAADFAAVLYSDLAPDNAETLEGEPFETLEIERRLMTTLPAGWKMGQFKAEQPVTNYPEFKREILTEIARCLHMPYNLVAGDSSSYNYSSGRLDHQTYYTSIGVSQSDIELDILSRIFAKWLEEAVMADPSFPSGVGRLGGWPMVWFWDGHEHVDPEKEATAQETRLRNHTTTLANEYATQGYDWETQLRQRAKELGLMKELGISAEAEPNTSVTRTSGDNADVP